MTTRSTPLQQLVDHGLAAVVVEGLPVDASLGAERGARDGGLVVGHTDLSAYGDPPCSPPASGGTGSLPACGEGRGGVCVGR